MYTDRKLFLVIALLLALWMSGVAGYMLIEHWSLLDSLFMTAISLTTVGYGEVHPLSPTGRLFTVVLIALGVGLFFYLLGVLAEAAVEGHIKGLWGRRKMEKAIAKLSSHYIVCGFGRIGRTVSRLMSELEVPVVVIERDMRIIEELRRNNILHVEGDATIDDVLIRAGIERAKGIICLLRSDADNVYIVLTARWLNPGMMIEARASSAAAETKMIQAGADRVMLPYEIGATRMALALLKPSVIEFLDLAVHSVSFDLCIEQVEMGQGCPFEGLSLRDAAVRQKTGVTVLAVQRPADKMILGPGPGYVLTAGDVVIALGDRKGLASFKVLAKGTG
jgi:voltage-gated potassium channel